MYWMMCKADTEMAEEEYKDGFSTDFLSGRSFGRM